MADLVETSQWADGVYQLEDTDAMKGGAPNVATKAGVDNVPHLQLAERTTWLKAFVETLAVPATTGKVGPVELATESQAKAGTNTSLVLTAQGAGETYIRQTQASALLTAADDLDTEVRPGFYGWQSSAPANAPSGFTPTAIVLVEVLDTQVIQTVIGGPEQKIAVRRRTNAVNWTAWNEMYTTNGNPAVLAPSGNQHIQSGLIFRWGRVSYPDISGSLPVNVAFPTSFPTACFGVTAMAETSQNGVIVNIDNITASTFDLVLTEIDATVVGGWLVWQAWGH